MVVVENVYKFAAALINAINCVTICGLCNVVLNLQYIVVRFKYCNEALQQLQSLFFHCKMSHSAYILEKQVIL